LPIPGNREAWLPILHTRHGQRHYSAFFSNTAHAHQMKKTKDCVVIYHNGHGGERQCTVITSPRGSSRRQRSCAAEKKNVQPVTRKLSLVLQSDNDRNNRFAFSIGIWD
jgi:hypothetical protein